MALETRPFDAAEALLAEAARVGVLHVFESVVDQILALHAQTGDFGTLMLANPNWTDKALARHSLELMAEKVLPAVNSALTRAAAAE